MLPWASPIEGLLCRRRVVACPARAGCRSSRSRMRMRPSERARDGGRPRRAEARAAGEPAAACRHRRPATFRAVPSAEADGPADPTNTCSRRSAVPRGPAPGATSSGLPSSISRGDLRRAWSAGSALGPRAPGRRVRPETAAADRRPGGCAVCPRMRWGRHEADLPVGCPARRAANRAWMRTVRRGGVSSGPWR